MTSRISSSPGCGSKAVRTQVAPAATHGPGSAVGGISTIRSNGSIFPARSCRVSSARRANSSGPGRSIGNNPSHRRARRTGCRCGQLAATHIGMRGCWTGGGWNSSSQYSVSLSSPRSKRRARARGSTSSPKGSKSSTFPSPTPIVKRPRLRRSRVTVSRATFWMRLRGRGVTMGPRRIDCVASAIALSITQTSATGRFSGG